MLHRLTDVADLIDRTNADVYLRGSLRRELVGAWAIGGAVGWMVYDPVERANYLSVLGDTADCARLLDELHPFDDPSARVTTHRPVVTHLLERGLGYRGGGQEWEFRWTTLAPPVTARVEWITDANAITALLDEHAPKSSSRPGDPHVRRWAGAFDADQLVAVAADTTGVADVGHISSVATLTSRRGEGWGGQVTAWLTGQLLADGAEVVTLGMFGSNTTAIRLYRRLGFTNVHQFHSGELIRL